MTVEIVEPVLIVAKAATEDEARALIDGFIDRNGWSADDPDPDVYLCLGRTDRSLA